MNASEEDRLLDLIENHLPEDLTAAQIAELRRAMRTSDRLRDALWAELGLEQGLAARYAPGSDRVDDVVADLIQRAHRRERDGRRISTLGFAFALIAVIGGTLAAVHFAGRRPRPDGGESAAATQPATAPSLANAAAGGDAAATTRPAPESAGPAVAAATGDPGVGPAVKPPEPKPEPEPEPAPPPEPEPAAKPPAEPDDAEARPEAPDLPPAWRLFDPVGKIRGEILAEQFKQLFQNVGGTHLRHRDWDIEVKRRFKLRVPLGPHRLLRMAPYDTRKFELEAWRDGEGVRISQHDSKWHAFLLERKGKHIAARRVDRDDRWPRFGYRPVDLRYQDGWLILAAADVPLVRAPLSGPPEQVFLEMDGHFAQVRTMPCRPLSLYRKPEPELILDANRPAALTWETYSFEKAQLHRRDDGSVEVTADEPSGHPMAWTRLTLLPGRVIDLRLEGFTEGAGFRVDMQDERRSWTYYVYPYNDTLVLAGDSGDHSRKRAFERGETIDKAFWVRIAIGLDQATLAFSSDGEHWGRTDYPQRLDSGHPVGKSLRFSLRLPHRKKDSAARVTRIRLLQRRALGSLAQPELTARAADAPGIDERQNPPELREAMAAARPEGVDPNDWASACDAALLRHSPHCTVRRDAAWDLLQRVARDPDRGEDVLAAAEEFARLIHYEGNHQQYEDLAELYSELAERLALARREPDLTRLTDSWLNGILRHLRRRRSHRSAVPKRLTRRMLYGLYDARRDEELLYQARRYVALHRDRRGGLPHEAKRSGSLLRFAQWAAMQVGPAELTASADNETVWDGSWAHPLSVELERESINAISEFIASVDAEAYAHAAKVLAGRILPDGIMPTGRDERLYQAIHFGIRRLIRTHDELARLLREQYAQLGEIRLRRALRDGDVETLRALAVQFDGTRPAREALYRLADRDLSMGNVVGAAEKYRRLLDEAGDSDPRRGAYAAKFRLAAALAGQEAGEAPKSPVALPGDRMSPGEFERMIRDLLKTRRRGGREMVVTPDRYLAPAPKSGGVEVKQLREIGADRHDRNRPFTGCVGYGVVGGDLILTHRGFVRRIRLGDGHQHWDEHWEIRHAPDESGVPAWPLLCGGRIVLRVLDRRETQLLCLDAGKGEEVWKLRFDEGVLSDPLLVNGWLYVLTYRTSLGGLADIHLRRISPETGRSSLAARLVRLRREGRRLAPGRLTLAGDRLVFRCAGTVVCCDLLGEVQWIRRLPFVPPDVDDELHELRPGRIIARDGRLILAARSCPYVQCIQLDSGREVWASLQPDLQRLVGVSGETVVAVSGNRVIGLDAATGRALWRDEEIIHPGGVLLAEKDSVLCIRLDEIKGKRRNRDDRRELRWVSAKDGRLLSRIDAADPKHNESIHDIRRCWATPREIVGLATGDTRKRRARLVRIRVR